MGIFKKLGVMLAALAAAALLSVPAFAEETYTLKIKSDVAGHTYEAYQIFSGDLLVEKDAETSKETKTLSNIEWGASVSDEGKAKFGSALKVANGLADDDPVTAEGNARVFAKDIAPYLSNSVATASSLADGGYVISGLKPGYYLVKDEDGTQAGGSDAYTEYIVEVVANVTVNPKSSLPTVKKQVQDIKDSTGVKSVWRESADYDIGDDVPFRLTAILANNLAAYESYKVVFHDTLSDALTYNGDAVVLLDDADVTDKFTVTCSGSTLTISCDDAKMLGAVNGSTVTVCYTAKLGENAVVGSTGNVNKVFLEYSNNPNQTSGPSETGKTPETFVTVYTYSVVANKFDQNGDRLEGAGFTLYKKSSRGEYVAVGPERKSETMTIFTWTGIDDGDYKLVETTTPAGYNTMEDVLFTVSAVHDLGGSGLSVAVDVPSEAVEQPASFKVDSGTGTLSTSVINRPGTVLPTTGGPGTGLLYAVGAGLVILAGALLVVRRRVGSSDE